MGFPGWLLMGFLSNRCWADRRLRLAQGPNEVFLEQGPNEVGKAQMPSPSPRRLAAAGARRPPTSVFVAIRAGGEPRRVRPRVPGSRRRGDEETTDHGSRTHSRVLDADAHDRRSSGSRERKSRHGLASYQALILSTGNEWHRPKKELEKNAQPPRKVRKGQRAASCTTAEGSIDHGS